MAISLIQSNGAFAVVVGTVAVTISPTAVDSAIVVSMSGSPDSASALLISVSDNMGNTYQQIPSARAVAPTGNYYYTDMFVCAGATPGVTVVTVSFSGSGGSGWGVVAAEFSGVSTNPSMVIDQVVSGYSSSGTDTPVAQTVSPTNSDDLLFYVITPLTNSPTTVSAPWAIVPGDPLVHSSYVIKTNNTPDSPMYDQGAQTYVYSGVAFFSASLPPIVVALTDSMSMAEAQTENPHKKNSDTMTMTAARLSVIGKAIQDISITSEVVSFSNNPLGPKDTLRLGEWVNVETRQGNRWTNF